MRQTKLTVLAYGEGEDEKIFLRQLVASYCRKNLVSVQTGSGGGGSPESVFAKAVQARRGEKRDIEYILLDTDKPWSPEMVKRAEEESIELIGNSPCLEVLFLEILDPDFDVTGLRSGACKTEFERRYCNGNNFSEDICPEIFTKAILNEARARIPRLNRIISSMEGSDN